MGEEQTRSRDEFESVLRTVERSYWDKHPFHQRMDSGELDAADLRAWVANQWCYQRSLSQRMLPSSQIVHLPDIRR
jgi:pyrroloquinoline-quinone synthase